MDGTEYITLKEAGEISGYSPDYIGQLIRRGKLTGKQVYANVAWVTTKDALRGYLEDKGKTKKTEDSGDIASLPPIIPTPAPLQSVKEEKVGAESQDAEPLIPELKKWERFLRILSLFTIVISTLFLILLFHVFSTLLDDRLERNALLRSSAPSLVHHL